MEESLGQLSLDDIIEREIELYSWENSIVIELTGVRNSLRDSEQNLTDVRKALEVSERKLSEILNSRSWRYTSCMRYLAGKVRGGLRKTQIGRFALGVIRRLLARSS